MPLKSLDDKDDTRQSFVLNSNIKKSVITNNTLHKKLFLSPLYLPLLEWKYNKNHESINYTMLYNINEAILNNTTYLSDSLSFYIKSNNSIIFTVDTLEYINVKHNINFVPNNIITSCSESDDYIKDCYSKTKKMTVTEPIIKNTLNYAIPFSEGFQTWPRLNLSEELTFSFFQHSLQVL